MKRIASCVAMVLVCGTLFSAAATFAAWQLWRLNALLYQAAIPGALGPFASAPPSASPEASDDDCQPPTDPERADAELAAVPYTPELAPPPAEMKSGERDDHKQVVFIAVESDGAPIEVGVKDDE